MTTQVPLEAFMRRVARCAEQIFDENGGQIPQGQLWFIQTADGKQETIATPHPPEGSAELREYKECLSDGLRQMFVEKGVTRYGSISECWVDGGGEMVVVEVSDGERTLIQCRDIIRPEHGNVYLGKPQDAGVTTGGRFTNMLRPRVQPTMH
jgi:hypothetical protein